MDEYKKTKIVALSVLIGATAFFFRMLGVINCDLPHSHTPFDINLIWCLVLSCLFWIGALAVYEEE